MGALLPRRAGHHVCRRRFLKCVSAIAPSFSARCLCLTRSIVYPILSRGYLSLACSPTRSLVVDAADEANFPAAKKELEELLSKNSLQQTPILVLANKNDLPGAKTADELKEALDLGAIKDRELGVYAISCKSALNIDVTMEWILKHAKTT